MKMLSVAIIFLVPLLSYSQIDSAFIARIKRLDTANILKLDTAEAPNDRLTQKIRKLRSEKTGFTLENILDIKIVEEQQKDSTKPKEFFQSLKSEINSGYTSKLLENCFINIYRSTFTEKEIDELIRFYKTPAGKKMDREFLILLVHSAKDAEQLLKLAANRISSK